MNLRRLLTLVLSIAISIAFLALALYSVDFGKLARAFASADYRLVALAGCFNVAGYMARTKRWQRLLTPSKPISLRRLFPVLVVGFALNNVLPGRPGEFARAYALGQREEISKTLGFATVVVERVMDGIALIGFLLLALAAFIPLRLDLPDTVKAIALASVAIFGIALAGLLFLLLREPLALRLFHVITRFMPRGLAERLDSMLGSFVVGLHSLKSPSDLLAVSFLSGAVWACESVAYFLILSAFGALPDNATRAVAAVFMMVLVNLGVMIPAAPGGLGPFEAAGVFALGRFGVDETMAATVALSAHSIQYLLITLLGLFFISREGASLARPHPDPTP